MPWVEEPTSFSALQGRQKLDFCDPFRVVAALRMNRGFPLALQSPATFWTASEQSRRQFHPQKFYLSWASSFQIA